MIYLDYAGSGLVRREVAERYVEYCDHYSLNPHGGTRQAETCRRAVLDAERRLLACLGIREGEATVIWTGGGTEALNMGIRGVNGPSSLHVVVDGASHPAMLESAKYRCKERGEPLFSVRAGGWNCVKVDGRALVCVCHVNNETGAIADFGQLRKYFGRDAIMIADGAQSFGKMPSGYWQSGRLDMLAVSSRKIGGPSSVGALIVRRGVSLSPLIVGGGQQKGLRSGTVDVVGAVMFADAAELAFAELETELRRLRELNDVVWGGVSSVCGERFVRLSPPDGHPGIVSFALPGYEGAVVKRLLAECHDIVIGTGSACSAESGSTSHVLVDMGIDEKTARGALRVSMGHGTTRQDIQFFLDALKVVLATY